MLNVFPVFLDQSWSKRLKRCAKLRSNLHANEFLNRRFVFRLRVDVHVKLLTALERAYKPQAQGPSRTYHIVFWFRIVRHFWDVDASAHAFPIFGLAYLLVSL